jgi:hypothetical protein
MTAVDTGQALLRVVILETAHIATEIGIDRHKVLEVPKAVHSRFGMDQRR